MKILLVDVDSKIPNIALGRISTWHKSQGHNVEMMKLNMRVRMTNVRTRIIDCSKYDKVYASNIFNINRSKFKIINCDDVSIGGVGSINPLTKLPPQMEDLEVDYSLYPNNKKSYGFITRGCIRKCSFCVVPKIEGNLSLYSSLDRIIKHKIVIFLDNNILSYKGHMDILRDLRDRKIQCQFNQGLDIRLVNDENAKLLSELNYFGKYIFAFDDVRYAKSVEKGTKIFQKYMPGKWRMRFLTYYHPNNPLHELVYRVDWAKRNFVYPFIMRDLDCKSSANAEFIRLYYTWTGSVNGAFCVSSFPQYMYHNKKNGYFKGDVSEVLNTYRLAKKGLI